MGKPIGFDQKIQRSYLDFTASELRYMAKSAMYGKMDGYLRTFIKGDKARTNTVTILLKIWCPGDDDHKRLQREALEAFLQTTEEEKLAFHWGLTMLAYPFFAAVAEEMGTLLKLQNEAPSQQLGRKIKLLYGDKRRVEVALSAVLGSMKAWGLVKAGEQNIYKPQAKLVIDNASTKNWILEVLLRVSEFKTMPLPMVNTQTLFFPFEFAVHIAELETKRIKVDRQGLDGYMLSLV